MTDITPGPTSTMAPAPGDALVVAEELIKEFPLGRRRSHASVLAVDRVSVQIGRGTTFGLVGESGSGKSTLARLLMRLETPTSGSVRFEGVDVFGLSEKGLRALRRQMQIVFQDPFGALNRRKTVAEIVALPMLVHEPGMPEQLRSSRVIELLDMVGLRSDYASRYPRELSGGQCQRVSLARALALSPTFVVLDEAVSAVDVSIQAQILNLLKDLQERLNLTYLFISHDLSVVRYMAQAIAVMYRGRVVELASRDELFSDPQHPYTRGLIAAIPSFDGPRDLAPVPSGGQAEDGYGGLGCSYQPSCPLGANHRCRSTPPELREIGPGRKVACHFIPHELGPELGGSAPEERR